MEPGEVKDRILENISLSVKKLQSYFAACEDETPAIRNHDKVLQRLCEHLDHALLYGNALVCSHDHLTLFLTLVSGLEFIRFDLDLDAPYLDLAPYMPDYYKPQYLLDFEDRLPSSIHGSDSLSLNSFNSVTSTNLEWDDSAIAPSSEDGDLTDTFSCPHSVASDLNGCKASMKSPTQRYNPFNEEKVEVLSSTETTPAHTASLERMDTTMEGTDQLESGTELEVIRLAKKKKTGKKKKVKLEEMVNPPAPSATEAGRDGGTNRLSEGAELKTDRRLPSPEGQERLGESSKHSALSQLGLRIPEMKDTSMESMGQPLSKVIDKLNGQLDPSGWNCPVDPPNQSFRTDMPEETPDGPPSGSYIERISTPMDFYRFTVESPNSPAPGGGHHDPTGAGQPPYVPGSPEAAGQDEEGGEGETAGAVEDTQEEADKTQASETETGNMEALSRLKGDQPSPSLSSAEDSGVEEGQGSPSEMAHPSEFRFFLVSLKSAMIKGCREPPYPSILTDATMEKLALAKFVAQESKCEVIPQGVVPTPCIPCCLVITDEKAFTCHEDCQTSFFRSLATVELPDVATVSTEAGKEYCIIEVNFVTEWPSMEEKILKLAWPFKYLHSFL
ncbi:unnamed protein product [Caretta caretta]